MTSYHNMSNASRRHRSPDTACVIQLCYSAGASATPLMLTPTQSEIDTRAR